MYNPEQLALPENELRRMPGYCAMHMLQKSDCTITEVAFVVGFNDSNYFTRQFRTITGSSPRQFRKQNSVS